MYSHRYKKVDEIPNGATIAIARDNADAARGLRLLARAGLITLKSDFSALSGFLISQPIPIIFNSRKLMTRLGLPC